jgi:hypothetical protein
MRRFSNPLDHVRIAAPCSADWDQMIGTERVRFCGHCSLNVYNLSEFTKQEAEAFIASREGRVCARFYRRTDGSILTKNCPVGLKAVRQRLSGVAKAASTAIVTFLAGFGVYSMTKPALYTPKVRMGVIAQPAIMGDVAIEVPWRAPVTEQLGIEPEHSPRTRKLRTRDNNR